MTFRDVKSGSALDTANFPVAFWNDPDPWVVVTRDVDESFKAHGAKRDSWRRKFNAGDRLRLSEFKALWPDGAVPPIVDPPDDPEQPPPVPGTAGGGFVHVQNTPSTVWDIEHNLGFDPAGQLVLDGNGDRWEPVAYYIDPGRLVRLTFGADVAGTAYLS